jgi:DNA invertase Pin-like site-specific DNA recombinase
MAYIKSVKEVLILEFGYGRVSTKDQNPDRQIGKFIAMGIEPRFIFIDIESRSHLNRPEYQLMKRMLRPGDCIFLDAFDRLGGNYDLMKKEWQHLVHEKKVDIVVLDYEQLFDSRKFRSMGDIGKILEDQLLSVLSWMAEQDKKRIKRTQRDGIEKAKEKGVKFGRPTLSLPDNFDTEYKNLINGEITATEAIRRTGMSASTFYRRKKEYKKDRKGS